MTASGRSDTKRQYGEVDVREFRASDGAAVRAFWEASGSSQGENPATPRSLAAFAERNPGLFLLALDERGLAATALGGWDGRRGDGFLDGLGLSARGDRRVRERAVRDVRAQFGKTAAAYVSSATHASGEDLERLVAVAAPRTNELALDLGCGVGHTLRRIAPLVAFAVGADATLEMMQAGRASVVTAPNTAFAQTDASALPFTDATFDLVTCRLAAHHFHDAASAFREVGRVLRPGGRFVFVDNHAPADPDLDTFINELETLRDASHVRNHTIAGWRRLVESAGLRASVASEAMTTKLTTEGWLERSQTPADRSGEVRRRLRAASPAAVTTFQITETTFAVPKVVMLGEKPWRGLLR